LLVGSVLTDKFRPDSDVDVLVQFEPDHRWSLFDQVAMQRELVEIFGRKVDLVSRKAIEGSAKRRHREILGSAKVIYEAA
jgi:predicted nucleotidyltransferase